MGIHMNKRRRAVQPVIGEATIKAGDTWVQSVQVPKRVERTVNGETVHVREMVAQLRTIEIVAAPTLSRAVVYRITRNDAHPHRVGKLGQIRRSDLRRKYGVMS